MRVTPFIISAVITSALIYGLNKQWGTVPPMGKFLHPQYGFWQNAEPAAESFNEELHFSNLKGKAEVYFDDRLVPHVFAENDEDLYFIQGYLHAKFRLFQMDLQTKAAEGRASEIAGPKAIDYDKEQRRLGMRFAAENAMKEIEKDPFSLQLYTAYTNGVNAYINSLTESSMPIEYKLLNFKPEKWSNLRTCLLLKMMAKMLSSGTEKDLAYTNAKSVFLPDELRQLYPQVQDSLLPIVPKGTAFEKPAIVPKEPSTADSLYFNSKETVVDKEMDKPDKDNGSNNWVVAGSKTQKGVPILCNDPHLELSLPSIWYEMQLKTPNSNAYGVSLPGSPFIIIGFNDSIAWGVTNAQRDVKDYYKIRFKDDKTKEEYWFDSAWHKTQLRVETIKVKGGKDVLDTVAYTVFGPVMYDKSFRDTINKGELNLAVRWTAHDPSNEGIAFYKLNRAKNYDEYATAIKDFQCPGQNFVFASNTGDIAIWQQGRFPARWDRQGLYVMPGEDSSYMWQGFIPQGENPHSKNPERGFLESANQRPADATYPYFIPGSYITERAVTIEHYLNKMNNITPEDMMKLQNNYYNTLAEDLKPLLLHFVNEEALSFTEKKYLDIFKNWDLMASPDSKGQTVYQLWYSQIREDIWEDDMTQIKPELPWPNEETTMEWLKRDTAFQFIDNRNTPQKETLRDIVTSALQQITKKLSELEKEGKLSWAKYKNPTIYHLLKSALPAFARSGLHVGGNGNIINAVTHSHGPSWRMIVEMSSPTEAYGVYPGGQSGNPGSPYYDNFIDNWVVGKYYKLWLMHDSDKTNEKIKWTMHFSGK